MFRLFSFIFLVLSLSSCGYNKIQSMDEEVKASWSEVENQYKRRADLVPNLVNAVKGYMKHEEEVLRSVIEARAKASSININGAIDNPKAMQKFMNAQKGLSSSLGRLLLTVEKYPELKANESFNNLMIQLEGITQTHLQIQ